MFTKSAKRLMATLFTYGIGTLFVPITTRQGSQGYTAYLDRSYWPFAKSIEIDAFQTNLSTGIWFGSGTDAPTDDDYNLKIPLSYDDVVGYVSVLNTKIIDDYPVADLLITVINKKSEEHLTISEIGYFDLVMTRYDTSWVTQSILIDRTVLDEPVIIPAKGTANIKYTITGQWT